MRKWIFILSIIMTSRAYAALPDTDYVSKYYYKQCGNPDLTIPGADGRNLVGRRWLLTIVDDLNEDTTTYASDADGDNIVSLGYLVNSLDKLQESRICCVGGYYDAPSDDCLSCGEWLVDSTDMCYDAGKYYNNGTCSSCGDGYICAAGTSARVECGAGYWCANNVRHKCAHGAGQCPLSHHTSEPDPSASVACDNVPFFATTAADNCVANNVYYSGSGCAACPDGYVCPMGSVSKHECGPGFWCADGIRTACPHGAGQCPSKTETSAPTATTPIACDNSWVFTS